MRKTPLVWTFFNGMAKYIKTSWCQLHCRGFPVFPPQGTLGILWEKHPEYPLSTAKRERERVPVSKEVAGNNIYYTHTLSLYIYIHTHTCFLFTTPKYKRGKVQILGPFALQNAIGKSPRS